MKTELAQLQQGDVTFQEIDKVPAGTKKVRKSSKGYVLAEGSGSGHSHVIKQEVEMFEKDNVRYLRVKKAVKVTHEEHKPVTLDKGIWQVGRVLEYDYIQQMERQVVD